MFITYLFDVIVMALLGTTITYCYILNIRLRRLRAHESELRSSIAQLFSASKKVESAVTGLKHHSQSLKEADEHEALLTENAAIELKRQISEAKLLMNKLQKVVKTAKTQGLSSDKLLDRAPSVAKAPSQANKAPSQASIAQNPVAKAPNIPNPQPLRPDMPTANQNSSVKFGRKASPTNGGQEAMDRLEESLSQIKRDNGRAA